MAEDTRGHTFESEKQDTETVRSLLNALRFRLQRNSSGKWCFSHVHFADHQPAHPLAKQLVGLMDNRTLNLILLDLADDSNASIQLDEGVKIEFRKYFADLHRLSGPEENSNEYAR